MTNPTNRDVPLVSDAMRGCAGGRLGLRRSAPIELSDVRRWLLAAYYPHRPPDLEREPGAVLAPQEFNPFAWAVPDAGDTRPSVGPAWDDPDRIETVLGVTGPGLPFMLNGGVDISYGARMRVGDIVSADERLAGYSERDGRLGPMLFTVTEERWSNQDGDWLKTLRKTLIRYGERS